MKRIRIVNYHKEMSRSDNRIYYFVYLGNRTFHRFRSEKSAQKFLSKTSQFLTDQLYESNFIVADLECLYRKEFWPLFIHDKKSMRSKNRIDESTIIKRMRDIDSNLKLVVDRSAFNNGNSMSFQFLINIIRSTKDMIKILSELNEKRSNAPVDRLLNSLLRRSIEIEMNIQKYGQLTAYRVMDHPDEFDIHHFQSNSKLRVV